MRAGLLTTSTSADVYSEAEPLGGLLQSSFPPARGLQYCIRGRYRPRQELRLEERGWQVNRGRLGRDVDQGLT